MVFVEGGAGELMITYARTVVVILIVLCGGCSTVKLAYDNADWLVFEYLEDYVDLDKQQADALNGALDVWHAEHRRTQIPTYVRLFGEARESARDGLTAAKVDWFFGAAKTQFLLEAGLVLPVIAPTLHSLSAAQIEQLTSQLQERNRHLQEKYLQADSEVRKQSRQQRIIERFEDWLGELDADQRNLIADGLDRIPDTANQWLRHQLRHQRALIKLLQSNPQLPEVEQFLTAWWTVPPTFTLDGARTVGELQIAYRDLLLEIDRTLSEKQRRHLLGELDYYYDSAGQILEGTLEPGGDG